MDNFLYDLSLTALGAAVEANEVAYYTQFGTLPGAALHDEPALLWMTSGIPISLFNGVLCTHTTEEKLGLEIERIVTYFRQRRLAFQWHLGPSSQPAALRNLLPLYGIHHDEDEPGMALDLHILNEDLPLAPQLDIQLVTSDEHLQQWLHTWGFPVPETIIQQCFQAYQPLYSAQGPLRLYLGMLNGRPVATGTLFEAAGVAGVHHIVTLPEVRHQGIGTTMTLALLRIARAQGYHISVLRASPYGINIYRRLGFRECCIMSTYVWHPQ